MADLIDRQAAIDSMCELMRHWFGCDSKDEIREIKRELGKLPSAQPEAKTNANGDWVILNKDKILKAGMEGREVDFRIGGRLFAIREKAQ